MAITKKRFSKNSHCWTSSRNCGIGGLSAWWQFLILRASRHSEPRAASETSVVLIAGALLLLLVMLLLASWVGSS
jgi:hypothetical protein